jgi:acetoacetate decarboxylase
MKPKSKSSEKKSTSGTAEVASRPRPVGVADSHPGPLQVQSIPWDAPLHGRPPARFMDCEVLAFQYRTDLAAIRALLPAPLEPVNDVVLVQIGRWGDVPGVGRDTKEANIMVAARFKSKDKDVVGAYSPYFYVTNDRAMAGGREFHGQPKRLAEVTLETRGDIFVGTVVANGIEVFTGTMHYKARRSTLADLCRHVNPVTNLNLKVLPHIDGRSAVRQITARDLVDIDVTECFTGTGTVEIRPHATVPMYRLPIREQLDAFYWCGAFSLVGGVVLHDFLLSGEAK